MPRPHDQDRYELSDAEKRDLIKLIEQGKPLPEKYRFLLFADKREVELVWNGKTREVCTAILPFQTLEHIDEPRKEKREEEELGLDTGGRQIKGWTNKLIWGDNKLILSSLKSGALRRQIEDAGGLKLIYIDPPFDVGADFSMDIEIGGETFHKEPNLLEQIAYRDTWGRGADSFIAMIYERLILMRDLMHEEALILLHMGWNISHHVRLAMDEVFGRQNFLNQIIWRRQTAHSDIGQGSEHMGRIHDVILLYAKSERFTWNMQYQPYSKEYVEAFYKHVDEKTGRRYRLSDATAPGGAGKGNPAFRYFGWARFLRRTGLMGAMRPQTPHRSPRQAFGGNIGNFSREPDGFGNEERLGAEALIGVKAGMDQNNLFAIGLGLGTPWKVVRSGLEDCGAQSKILYVDIDFEEGSKFPCPICGKPSAVYDSEAKRWRHMNFWQHATFLSARVPRVECPEHKVRQVQVPWARAESGFTLMFEALVMALVKEMPVSAVGALVGEHDTRLWRIVRHYVDAAHAAQRWNELRAVAIDETATRKGHRYATVVVEIDLELKREARLLFMTPERTAASVGQFVEAMDAHGASAQQVEMAAIDMGAAYQKGVAEHLPQAQVVFDRFHVMKLAGDATDEVRRELRAQGADVKGGMWALRGNWENLKQEQRELRVELCARHKALGRALALRESLQGNLGLA